MSNPSEYLNHYRNRVGNVADRMVTQSKNLVDRQFDSHPNSRVVLINGVQFTVLYVQGKDSDDKSLLLKSGQKIDIGSVVVVDDKSYLTMDFLGEGINDIYPKATLKLCNSTFPIESNKTSILKGTDDFGRPIYEETSTVNHEPCIVENKFYTGRDNEQLPLPEGKMNITMKYQVANNLTLNSEFEMYNNSYKIMDIDYTKVINGKGIMIIRAERLVG